MRPLFTAATALLLVTPLAACAQAGGEKPAPGTPHPPMTGGWSATTVTPEIEELAVWAFNQIDVPGAEMASVENVSQQVVAGMNYRMDLVFTDGRRWRVQIYRRFNGEKTVTSAAEVK